MQRSRELPRLRFCVFATMDRAMPSRARWAGQPRGAAPGTPVWELPLENGVALLRACMQQARIRPTRCLLTFSDTASFTLSPIPISTQHRETDSPGKRRHSEPRYFQEENAVEKNCRAWKRCPLTTGMYAN
jgi:hypothetical protein